MTPTKFENHPIFEKITQFSSRIEEEELRDLFDINDINFFEAAISYLKERLHLTIPTIVHEAVLNHISQQIESSLKQINAYVGNRNIGYVANAINHLQEAISKTQSIPLPFTRNEFAFSKHVADFEKITKEKYASLETENKELKEELNTLSKKLKQTDQALETINTSLKQKELEIQNLNKQFQANFEAIKTSATQNYEHDRKTFRNEFNKSKESLKNEVEKLKSEINTGTDQIIKNLEFKLEEAKKIVGVVSDKTVTGNYQKVANNHKTTADIFRGIAIALMICLSGILIYTIWDISGENFDWTKSLIRILAAAALSYPATYAARESNKHRKLEVLNRKAELELTAINPFIELLPEQKKQAIKEKLVEKYFGNSGNLLDNLDNKKGEDISIGSIERLIKILTPFIKNKL